MASASAASLVSLRLTVTSAAETARTHRPVSEALHGRRRVLFLLPSSAVLTAGISPAARAQDIPLFGLRKKLERIEEEAEEIVKEGEAAVEKGIESAEKEVEAAEVAVEGGFGGGLVQAGAVAGAEAVGVLVVLSVVNGILGPEAQKS